MPDCFNCGLPNPRIKAKIKLKPNNRYNTESIRALPFCSEECALQTMFLQLSTHSTIRYSEFKSKVTVELVNDGLTVTKPPIQAIDFKGSKMAKNEEMTTSPHFEFRNGGRPRKWNSGAERQRAYRQSHRSTF